MAPNIMNEIVSEDLIVRLDEAWDVAHFAQPVEGHPAREDDIDDHQSLGCGVVDEDVAGNVVDPFVAELKRLVGCAECVLVLEGSGRERPCWIFRHIELGEGVRLCDDSCVGVGGGDEGGSANVICMRMAVDEMSDWKVGGVADGEENLLANRRGCVDEDYTRRRDDEEGLIHPFRDQESAVSKVFHGIAGRIQRNTGCRRRNG